MDCIRERVPSELIQQINKFSSCEIADALVKLKHPGGGYLPDINLQTAAPSSSNRMKLCGQAFTVEMVSTTNHEAPHLTEHFVDSGEEGTVMVISSPANSKNAVWGGLMTARAKVKGIKGVVIDGRCRDLSENREADYPVFARGHSILGQSTFTRASRIQVPITIHPVCDTFPSSTHLHAAFPRTIVNPYDIILGDEDGVVVIPSQMLTDVIGLCTKNVQIDKRCLEALQAGKTIAETFAEFRRK